MLMSSSPVSKARIEPRMTYVHMTWTLCHFAWVSRGSSSL